MRCDAAEVCAFGWIWWRAKAALREIPATAMPDPIDHAVVLGPIKAKPFGWPREVRDQP